MASAHYRKATHHHLYIHTHNKLGVRSRAVLISRNARLISIFTAGNDIEAQNNDCYPQHLLQILIKLHGPKSTRKHTHRLI